MAKKFSPALGVEILFDRTHEIEIGLPSGRTLKTRDVAPAILVVEHLESTSYFCRAGDTWAPVAEVNVGEIITELDAADEVKRAPKF